MRCPYCSSPTVENQGECPRCGFALHKLEGWFGAVPRLTAGLSDNAALFTPRDYRKLEGEIARFTKTFPQLHFHLLTVNLNPGDNLALYTFWIFNRSGICNDMAPGADNRNILMVIDAFNARLCLTAGYGLEPFLGERHLAAAGNVASADLHAGRFFEGSRATLEALTATLVAIHDQLGETYGVDMSEVTEEERNLTAPLGAQADDSPY